MTTIFIAKHLSIITWEQRRTLCCYFERIQLCTQHKLTIFLYCIFCYFFYTKRYSLASNIRLGLITIEISHINDILSQFVKLKRKRKNISSFTLNDQNNSTNTS